MATVPGRQSLAIQAQIPGHDKSRSTSSPQPTAVAALQRNAAGGNRPLGPLAGIDFGVEHVVEHHAAQVQQARRGDQQARSMR